MTPEIWRFLAVVVQMCLGRRKAWWTLFCLLPHGPLKLGGWKQHTPWRLSSSGGSRRWQTSMPSRRARVFWRSSSLRFNKLCHTTDTRPGIRKCVGTASRSYHRSTKLRPCCWRVFASAQLGGCSKSPLSFTFACGQRRRSYIHSARSISGQVRLREEYNRVRIRSIAQTTGAHQKKIIIKTPGRKLRQS